MRMNSKEIEYKIDEKVGDPSTYEKKIKLHIDANIPYLLLYQCINRRLRPNRDDTLSTIRYKRILAYENYLGFINDIFGTHMSNDGINTVVKKFNDVKDFNRYELAIKIFKECNQKSIKIPGTKKKRIRFDNAYSYGTKILHFFKPNEYPMLDSIIRKELKMQGFKMGMELCVKYKDAMNLFADKHRDYFELDNLNIVVETLNKYKLELYFPRMKLLDMALYQENDVKNRTMQGCHKRY